MPASHPGEHNTGAVTMHAVMLVIKSDSLRRFCRLSRQRCDNAAQPHVDVAM